MGTLMVCRGGKHVVEVCRGQHVFLKGVVMTFLVCRGAQGVVKARRGQQRGVQVCRESVS